jgi:hypothetical protein
MVLAEPNGIPIKNIQIELFDRNGSVLNASFDGNPAASSHSLTLSSFQEKVIKLSDPGDAIKTGWVRVTSWPGTVDSSIRYTYSEDIQSQELESDVVCVAPTDKTSYWTVTLDQQTITDSIGLAIANPNGFPIDVRFELWSNNTAVPNFKTVGRHIGPNGHLTLFIDELFGARFNGIGTLTIYANGYEMYVLCLRLDGIQTSTLPANELSAIWNWSAGRSGGDLGGQFFINMVDSGSFMGLITTPLGLQDESTMRGYLSGSRFVAEHLYQNSEFDKGTVLYIGTQTGSGLNATISGAIVSVRDDGTVWSTRAFTAQRTN